MSKGLGWVFCLWASPPHRTTTSQPSPAKAAAMARSEGGPGQVTHKTLRLRNCKQLPLFKMLPPHTHTHKYRHPNPRLFAEANIQNQLRGKKAPQSSEWECLSLEEHQGPMLEVWGAFCCDLWPSLSFLYLWQIWVSYMAQWTMRKAWIMSLML